MKTPEQTLKGEIKVFELLKDYLNENKVRLVAQGQKTENEVETLIQDCNDSISKYVEAIEILKVSAAPKSGT